MPIRNGKIVSWKVKVKGLRNLLTEDDSDENTIKVSKKYHEILTSSLYKKYFKNFDRLDEFLYVTDAEEFNDILVSLWDYCDYNLIWIDFD